MSLSGLVDQFGVVGAIVMVALLFGASIFVHELGHFLAARRLGLQVPRFSIGFGPKLFGWTRGGTEYRISLLPLGGYVALPQLADLSTIEGDDEVAPPTKPLRFRDKFTVLVAGAVFNVIFAFLLATVVWALGEPTAARRETTVIGWVANTLGEAAAGEAALPSPAAAAGLRPGDRILKIDGREVDDFGDITTAIVAGTERTPEGEPLAVFEIERDGVTGTFPVRPRIDGPDKLRRVGISPADELVVERVLEHSPAALAGLQGGDRILALNGAPFLAYGTWAEALRAGVPFTVDVERKDGPTFSTTLAPVSVVVTTDGEKAPDVGVVFGQVREIWRKHVPPHERVAQDASLIVRFLQVLLHRGSDVGLQQMSGPVGILSVLYQAARFDLASFLALAVLININLAIFNLLPLPVLDGGQIVFAAIGRLRGRPLPASVINGFQSAFVLLFLGLMLYVSIFDVRRAGRDLSDERSYRDRVNRAIEPVFPPPGPAVEPATD